MRDVRGFATKFYTQEGNWDLVGNDIPVFFIQEAMKFPDFVHAVKPEPHNEVPTGQSAVRLPLSSLALILTNYPISTIISGIISICSRRVRGAISLVLVRLTHTIASHMVMWAMSDRGIPRSYRMMQGFGVNTFTLTNPAGELFFVKFHWLPELGVHSLTWDEALKICGQDPGSFIYCMKRSTFLTNDLKDFHRKDLNEAIENGAPPKWTMAIQVIPEADEHKFDFDILDATKIWPEELVPLIPVGEMVLNKTVDEFFTQTEQVAFCTSHVVPGIGFSDDPLLQGRNFSYFDTQISRLGINWEEVRNLIFELAFFILTYNSQLPINRPVCPYMNFNRDGQGRHRVSKGTVNYWPNRFEQIPPVAVENGGYRQHPAKISGIKERMRGLKFQEHYSQAQLFYNSLADHEKFHLIKAISFELSHCDDPMVYKNAIPRLNEIDHDMAVQVAKNVGGPTPSQPNQKNHGKKSKGLSQLDFMPKIPSI